MTDKQTPRSGEERQAVASTESLSSSQRVSDEGVRHWRRRVSLLVLLVGTGLAGTLLVWLLRQSRMREALLHLPVADITNLDPSLTQILTDARAAITAKPLSGRAWGHYGSVLIANDYVPEAAACFARAELFEPNEVRWPYLRGVGLARIEPDQSVSCFRRAIRLREDLILPKIKLAELLLSQGQPEEAEVHLRSAENLEPRDPRVLVTSARLALMRGQIEQALQWATRAEQIAPRRRNVHQLLSQIHLRRGDAAAVEDQLRMLDTIPETQSEDGDDPFLSETAKYKRGSTWTGRVAEQLIAARRFQEAIATLQQAGGQDAPDVLIAILLGKALLRSGNLEDAEETLNRALQRDPKQAPVHFELGNLSLIRTQWDNAVQHYQEAVRLKPDFAVAYYNLGLCQRQLHDRDAAIASFLQACRYMPDNSPAHRDLADLLFEVGRDEQALYHVQMAARLSPNDPAVQRLLERAQANRETIP